MKKHLLAAIFAPLLGICGGAEPDFHAGVCTHFAQNKGDAAANLDLVAQAGITSIRDEVSWAMTERKKGELKVPGFFADYLEEAARRDIRPLVILNYGNRFYDKGNYPVTPESIEGYKRYCGEIVRFSGGRVRLFQLWNEWDGGCGMSSLGFGRGKAAGYVKMLKEVYPQLKKIAPEATFIAGSVCTGETFFEELLKLGMLDFCDAVSFHAYNYNTGDSTAEAWFARMQKLGALIRRYTRGADKPLYITEIGWPNHTTETGSTEWESAVKLARLYLYARQLPFIKGVWYYDFQDDGWKHGHHENNFGLVRPDLTPKTSYFALKSLARRLSFGKPTGSEEFDGGSLFRFEGEEGPFWAVVNRSEDHDLQLVFESGDPSLPLTVEVVGSAPVTRPWGYRDWPNRERNVNPNRIAVTVGEMPVLLSGNLDRVRIAAIRKHPFPRSSRPGKIRLQLPRSCAEAVPQGEKNVPTAFRDYRKLAGTAHGGAADLAATFESSYDRENLRLTVTVTDDVFHQPESNIANAWRGDGIQLAFRIFRKNGGSSRTELDAALIGGKAALFLREAQGDRSKTPECAIERQGNRTVYRFRIPARLLGAEAFEPGGMLTCAFLVNDNDGAGRKGFLAWGDGIGITKNPDRYNLLIFK